MALSSRQEDLGGSLRDEWIGVGLQAAAANRKEAEKGVADAYRSAGLEPPTIVIWLDSPLAGAVGTAYLRVLLRAVAGSPDAHAPGWRRIWESCLDQAGRTLGDPRWDRIERQVGREVARRTWNQVRGQVRSRTWNYVRRHELFLPRWGRGIDHGRDLLVHDSWLDEVFSWPSTQHWLQERVQDQVGVQARVHARLCERVQERVWNYVGSHVSSAVLSPIGGERKDLVRRRVWQACGGQHDAGDLAFFDYWQQRGMPGIKAANGFITVARNAGWWWPLTGIAVLTERPCHVHVDDAGRLHSAWGPAIVYPDGFGVWAWHGMRLARKPIKEPIRLEQIKHEPNIEIRRVMTERYGLERYLRESKAKLVHQDNWGKLWRLHQPPDEDLCMVEVLNSTAEPDGSGSKTFMLRVDPKCRPLLEDGTHGRPQKPTALNAVASTFGLTGEEYCKLLIET